jgi:GT2 family glycosyltransferase
LIEAAAYEGRYRTRGYQAWLVESHAALQDRLGDSEAGPRVTVIVVDCDSDQEAQQALAAVRSQGVVVEEFFVIDDDGRAQRGDLPDAVLTSVQTPYVFILPAGAILAPRALELMVQEAESSKADVVYSDEDRVDDSGHLRPFFKPDFSIDLARAQDFVGPAYLLRTDAYGALRDPVGSVSGYGLLLTAYERGLVIRHVPEVLVHWFGERRLCLQAGQQALADAQFERISSRGEPASGVGPTNPDVSVIIPTRDRIDLLARCIESIYETRINVTFEIIVLDNRSELESTARWLEDASSRWPDLRVVSADYDFNWSKLNNHGVRLARGKVFVFLNNDTEAIVDYWLDRLVRQSSRPDIGSVGALLLYPDGLVQHAGVVIGIGGLADHVYAGVPADEHDYHSFVSPMVARNVLACTGACLAVERTKFDAVGGFNEDLQICGDVHLCLRLVENGYLNLYDPEVRMTHFESATRTRTPLSEEEIERIKPICQQFLDGGDPFYNPNLMLGLRYPTCWI